MAASVTPAEVSIVARRVGMIGRRNIEFGKVVWQSLILGTAVLALATVSPAITVANAKTANVQNPQVEGHWIKRLYHGCLGEKGQMQKRKSSRKASLSPNPYILLYR